MEAFRVKANYAMQIKGEIYELAQIGTKTQLELGREIFNLHYILLISFLLSLAG